MGPRPQPAVFTRTLFLCVVITWLIHVVTYLLNTQLPLHIVALGGSYGQIGWLFAVNTGIAMVLRPQVGGWVDRYGARALMLAGGAVLVVTMGALNVAARVIGSSSRRAMSTAARLISWQRSLSWSNDSSMARRPRAWARNG